MAFQFANLQPSGTVRFTLTGIRLPGAAADVVLILKHAGKGNPGWESARRKLDTVLKARTGGGLRGEDFVEKLLGPFSKYVVVGWENVFEDGQPVAFTATKGEDFLRGLIDAGGIDFVDQAMTYALDRAHFRDLEPPAAEDLGKG